MAHILNRWSALALSFLLMGANARADEPSAADQAFFLEAANCAAALEASVVDRQNQVRSDARDEAMLRDVEHGFVFVGVAYKRGLRNPQADDMLHAAEKRWLALPQAEKEARLHGCTHQARQLMDDISMLERFLVRNRASSRLDRLLEKEQERDKNKSPARHPDKP